MGIALAIMILFPFALIPCEAQQKPEAKYTLEKLLDALGFAPFRSKRVPSLRHGPCFPSL